MTTKQQNYKFLQDVADDLARWSQKPTFLMVSASFIMLVTLTGGLFFWANQFSYAFEDRGSDQSQLETANSGLQTMKRMVGDQQIWSKSIQEEYDRLFSAQSIKTQPLNYSENFIGQNYSSNQVSAK